jgi:hypothetical protein
MSQLSCSQIFISTVQFLITVLATCKMLACIMQVVLLWNLDVQGGLANGTRGVVERMASVREYLTQEGLVLHDRQQQQQQYRSLAWQQGGSSSWCNQQQQQQQSSPLQQQQQHWGAPPHMQQQPWQQQQQHRSSPPHMQQQPWQQQQQHWGSPLQQQWQQQPPITPPPPPPPAAGAFPRYNDQQVQAAVNGKLRRWLHTGLVNCVLLKHSIMHVPCFFGRGGPVSGLTIAAPMRHCLAYALFPPIRV